MKEIDFFIFSPFLPPEGAMFASWQSPGRSTAFFSRRVKKGENT
jgi:hypothetical protein